MPFAQSSGAVPCYHYHNVCDTCAEEPGRTDGVISCLQASGAPLAICIFKQSAIQEQQET